MALLLQRIIKATENVLNVCAVEGEGEAAGQLSFDVCDQSILESVLGRPCT